MKQSDIKRIVKDSMREAFYTRKDNFFTSKELENMLTESLNEYLQDVDGELELWLEDYDKVLLKEGMTLYVKGLDLGKKLQTIHEISWELMGRVFKFIQTLPQDQQQYFQKNKMPEVLTIDGYDPDPPTGVLNLYTAGLTTQALRGAMKVVFDGLKELGITYGKVKTEPSRMFKSQVIRIPILKNPHAGAYKGPPELDFSNTNAYQIFHNVLQYPGEHEFEMKASELMERIESLAHDKGWIDKNKINPTDSARGDKPFDDPDIENPHFDIVNQLGAGGARMIGGGLSGDDIRMRLGLIWNFAKWAVDHGYQDLYVA